MYHIKTNTFLIFTQVLEFKINVSFLRYFQNSIQKLILEIKLKNNLKLKIYIVIYYDYYDI